MDPYMLYAVLIVLGIILATAGALEVLTRAMFRLDDALTLRKERRRRRKARHAGELDGQQP